MSLRLLFPTVALTASLVLPAAASGPAIAWRDWDTGLREAQQRGRPVLVDVYTKWCGWCKRMDRDVYSREDVRDYLRQKFVTVKLDAEAPDAASYEDRDFTSRTLASHFRVNAYPTTLFLRSGGEHLVSVPGYVEADNFLLLLRYIGDGHFDHGTPWEEFKAEHSK